MAVLPDPNPLLPPVAREARAVDPRWQPWRRHATRWQPPAVPTVVVVPHPDDEVLLHGGLILRQRTRGVPVTVIAVTDGEAAYSTVHPSTLADRRRVEQHRALALLGVDPTAVIRLGLPDGAVADHEDELVDALTTLTDGAELVVAPWIGDHHSDHEACGRAAVEAAGHHGLPVRHGLFWGWMLGSPTEPPFDEMLRIDLSSNERRTRTRALGCHRSQVTDELATPMLAAADLEPFMWPVEHYISNDRR